ncbi:ABC transporter permease subunit [Lysinibacillus parviboronicapiens]|uniref:ABC transporter permease subunit n=1 Tax=Lysinibacillus TaxID=400634 RepID=UPI0006D10415|nr:ABC transporter permease subunit [Lysinibacillus parviboronicapiens]
MVNFHTVYKIEWKKIIKRRELIAFFTMIAIPLLYSLGAYFESSIIVFNSDEKEYAGSFVVNMLIFGKMLFIYFLIAALFATKSLGGEIENRSILLYTQRIPNRAKIYRAKLISMYSAIISIIIFYSIISLILYYVFVLHREDIATKQFLRADEFLNLLYIGVGITFLYLFVISFSMMLSTFLKSNTATILFCLLFIIFTFIAEFPGLKYISFEYYLGELIEMNFTSSFELTKVFLIYVTLILVMTIASNRIGIHLFKRRDL